MVMQTIMANVLFHCLKRKGDFEHNAVKAYMLSINITAYQVPCTDAE